MNGQRRGLLCVWALGIFALMYAASVICLAGYVMQKLPLWGSLLLLVGVAPAVAFYAWFGVDVVREARRLQRELKTEAKPTR